MVFFISKFHSLTPALLVKVITISELVDLNRDIVTCSPDYVYIVELKARTADDGWFPPKRRPLLQFFSLFFSLRESFAFVLFVTFCLLYLRSVAAPTMVILMIMSSQRVLNKKDVLVHLLTWEHPNILMRRLQQNQAEMSFVNSYSKNYIRNLGFSWQSSYIGPTHKEKIGAFAQGTDKAQKVGARKFLD